MKSSLQANKKSKNIKIQNQESKDNKEIEKTKAVPLKSKKIQKKVDENV